MSILVTGGLGYIGSHTVIELLNKGYNPIVVDNLSNAKIEMVDQIKKITGKDIKYYIVDLLDKEKLDKIFLENKDIEDVIHFAGSKAVGESCIKPLMYYENNIMNTINLLNTMIKYGVKNIILVQSSRCVCKFKKEDFNKKLQRFNKIASEASEQSHRLIIPTIKDIIDFKDIKNYSFDHAYIAYEKEENNTFKNSFNNVKPHQSIGIIIGSEGGFSQEEVEYAINNGYKSLSLGKRILRSETACLYSLSVLSFLVEDL